MSRVLANPLAFGQFNAAGRMTGCFVYMLFCQDGGPVYVKIGISEHPDDRLAALRTTCAVTPRAFSVIEVRNRKMALRVERALQRAFAKDQTTGEWFVFPEGGGAEFRSRRREVLKKFDIDPTRPLHWSTVHVKPLADLAAKKRRYYYRRHKRMLKSRAYQDFRKEACKP